ncbi:bifunctional [glutamate--ammonia ligase]-adenylyl-L-tyrosine phosphorylase/[glutamate--ammonia-ligase] adenylyltransferase [Hydrogenophilus thiooxidans]|uniref:bifunctional [glutamate--ammonia ligase]-adenylyl-L-tyrosine phosphorylase/[glutamate--ammonia-ligase] adenylyltransferase n=1 Tax=Hydrogenophilus thiooxidans TaxID=2820326 RepID=UPI001C211CD0
MTVAFSNWLTTAVRYSPHLAHLLSARPWLADWLAKTVTQPLTTATLEDFLQTPPFAQNATEIPLDARLRQMRAAVFAHCAVRDLALAAPLEEITGAMTRFAECAIRHAYDHHYAALIERHGRPQSEGGWEQEFLIVGMGKLGGGELNVSSDIDLVFVYPEEGETAGPKILSNAEFFTKLGRRLIQTLAEPTGDGWVFRVDMRLRPHGDSGPLVVSFEMLEDYLMTQGRTWERYAWIKARALTGERWQELENLTRPFVYRKYLDFGAIEAVRDLHAQIRREVARKERQDHIKLGRGGIREIEFIAQVHQLIRGGREPTLQVRPTRTVLRLIAERGLIAPETQAGLDAAYCFLRRVEHRLQYWHDAQTHELPKETERQALLAEAMGYENWEAFRAALDHHREFVSRTFDALFGKEETEQTYDAAWFAAADPDEAARALESLGYADPRPLALRLEALKNHPRLQAISPASRRRRDQIVAHALTVAAQFPAPDTVLARLIDLFEAIGGRTSYFALLDEYPQALEQIAKIVASSRWAATYLARHPILIDEALDARALDEVPNWAEFQRALTEQLALRADDTEAQMNWLREAHHAQLFRLLLKDLAGRLTVERLSDHLSALADAVLEASLPIVWKTLRRRHTETPHFAVIAYGKLGGKELGYASDLDLVYLFDDDHPDALDSYCRFAQRLATWWSTRTAAGELFEIDLRLRPDGEAGLPATPYARLVDYLIDAAWTWEHQALTRARFAAGDPALGKRFEALRRFILAIERDTTRLAGEIVAMREKIRAEHPAKAGQFNLKHDFGGLIDVEFLVQYLVLAHAPHDPELAENAGNIALLSRAAARHLIPSELAEAVAETYRHLRREQHRLRLDEKPAVVPAETITDRTEPVRALWHHLFAHTVPASKLGAAKQTYRNPEAVHWEKAIDGDRT